MRGDGPVTLVDRFKTDQAKLIQCTVAVIFHRNFHGNSSNEWRL